MRTALVLLTLLTMIPGFRVQRLESEFLLPDDLEIALWAESPMFFNPTNIDVDARGRVWVTLGFRPAGEHLLYAARARAD